MSRASVIYFIVNSVVITFESKQYSTVLFCKKISSLIYDIREAIIIIF